MTGETLTQLQERVQRAFPGDLHISGVLLSTGKTVLFRAWLGDESAVVKVLIDQEPFWLDKFAAEVAIYHAFKAAPPPVPVPTLLGSDADAGILVVTHLPGDPVATDRYPTTLPAPLIELLVDTGSRMRAWQTPPDLLKPVFDYPARYLRYRDLGLFNHVDVAALTTLTSRAEPTEAAHGDLLPTNVLHRPTAAPSAATISGLLDFEFTGLYLPCFDLALLWVILGSIPTARERVETAVGNDTRAVAGFWINVAMVATRELRTHSELEAGHPLREKRLAALTRTWALARHALYDIAEQA